MVFRFSTVNSHHTQPVCILIPADIPVPFSVNCGTRISAGLKIQTGCVWYALSCTFSVALLLENSCIKITWFEQSRFTIGWLWSFAEFPEFFDILEVDPWVKSAGSGLVMNPSLNFFRSLTSIGFEKNNTSIGIPQLASPWYRFWYLFKSGQPLFIGIHRFNRVNR